MGEAKNKERQSSNSWDDWGVEEIEEEDLQAAAPAPLDINNHGEHKVVGNSSRKFITHALEDSTEYEYLKNILFQYMMGNEPKTLSKVLATVVKFSPEQITAITKNEERKKWNLGI